MKVITTDERANRYWEETERARGTVEDCMHVVNVYPEVTDQEFRGFGGALTEAAAHVFARMGKGNRQRILADCYGADGLRYSLGRIHMNSCDFALGNYSYVQEGDASLATFDIAHDRAEILPLIMAADGERRDWSGRGSG